MTVPQPLQSRLIGALFVERGLVSESQVRVALEIQRETGQQLGQILVDRFGVSRKELASVVAQQWAKLGGSAGPEDNASWRRLGEIFVERGFVTQEELDGALERQRQTGERLGEALVAQGVISKFELAGALAEQMATLGDADARDEGEDEQAAATVHHLPVAADPSEVPYGAPVAEEREAEEALAHPERTSAAIELVVTAAEDVPEMVEPVLEAAEPAARADEVAAAREPEPAEPTEVELVTFPAPEPVAAAEEPVPAFEPEPDTDPGVEQPPADPFPQPAELLVLHAHEATNGDAAEAQHPIAEIACLAFAPTTTGYRLLGLDTVPEPGETVDLPDVGEYLVLRIGRAPVPHDDRVCAFLEERVTPALVESLSV